MKKKNSLSNVKNLTLLALMTALVVLTQIISANIKFGPFSITLAHIPIVIGTALLGQLAGAWLGLATGATILLSGDAAAFMTFNAAATIFLVLLKGAASGLVAGFIYRLIAKKNSLTALTVAAFLCPLVNTGIFFAGCFLFFFDLVTVWAGGSKAIVYVITGLIGWNFLVELGTSLVLTPVTGKIIAVGKKMHHDKSYL